jgi:prephenate dehydratase
MSDSANPENMIAFQGQLGANSHLACQGPYPDMQVLPCGTFEEALGAVSGGQAKHAMIPIENSVAGRVADIHHLLPESGLYIIAEHFQRVNHQLLARKGARLEDLTEVHSHVHALAQCRRAIKELALTPVIHADTAGAARDLAASDSKTVAVIASDLAAEIYGLDNLRRDVEDEGHNTTRFIVMSRDAVRPKADDGAAMTSLVFRVRNVPAALYKAMGGFATNGVNMVKLESYQLGGSFNATQFYADVAGHVDDRGVQFALEELEFFTSYLKILGVYPASPFRSGFL